MTAYYNEFDPYAAAWLRELIKADLIAPGDVDERSIKEVQPDDLKGYEQVHLFAGIGGWSYALRLAGVADDARLWTGSCPCQPFSQAGKRKGPADERHLWPEMRRLIAESGPTVVFGEQVASKDGRQWLAGVFADLEVLGYAAAGADLCAASVGAPHIRQRLWWVADAGHREPRARSRRGLEAPERCESFVDVAEQGCVCRVSDAERSPGSAERINDAGERTTGPARDGAIVVESGAGPLGMEYAESDRRIERRAQSSGRRIAGGRGNDRLGDTGEGFQERIGDGRVQLAARAAGAWQAFELAGCRDGKSRRVAPGVPLLAYGIPGRVGRLRGYGNAIVPQVAAQFIAAYFDVAATTPEPRERSENNP